MNKQWKMVLRAADAAARWHVHQRPKHISAVERAGLSTLNEGQHLEFEIEENRGKSSAVNLKVK